MKFSIALLFLNLELFAEAATLRNAVGQEQHRRLRKPQTKECTVLAVADYHLQNLQELTIHSGEDETFECEMDPQDMDGISGLTLPIQATPEQKHVLKMMLDNGELQSGESTIFEAGSEIDPIQGLFLPPDVEIKLGKRNKDAGQYPRHLAVVTGDKPILAVKVTDSVGKVRPESPAQIGDDIFGTLSDPLNLKSQMSACSFGQLNVIPGNIDPIHEAAAGVIEVTIPITLEGNDRYTIRNAVTTAVQNKLGFSLPGPFQQVMYILEGCYVECGWAAYAYINSWNSVYQGVYYKHVGVQMHGESIDTIFDSNRKRPKQ
jgi:hypothetical protein